MQRKGKQAPLWLLLITCSHKLLSRKYLLGYIFIFSNKVIRGPSSKLHPALKNFVNAIKQEKRSSVRIWVDCSKGSLINY